MGQKPSHGPHENGSRHSRASSSRNGLTPEEAARFAARRETRRKQVRRNRLIGLLVLLVLLALIVLGIVGAVRFFMRDKQDETPAQSVASTVSSLPDEGGETEEDADATAPRQEEEDTSGYSYYEEGIPLLLNKWNPLPEELMGELDVEEVGVRPDTGEMHYLVPVAAKAFLDMVEAAEEEGVSLYPVSGYRSHSRQVSNYNARVSEYVGQGYSQTDAEDLTGQLIAVPGTSEHEAGLAIDINSLDQSFEYAKAFTWLSENCNRFGFILRYEKTTFGITGIDYEPWHYRYVGDNHALAIAELGVTLEEYVEMLEAQEDENDPLG